MIRLSTPRRGDSLDTFWMEPWEGEQGPSYYQNTTLPIMYHVLQDSGAKTRDDESGIAGISLL